MTSGEKASQGNMMCQNQEKRRIVLRKRELSTVSSVTESLQLSKVKSPLFWQPGDRYKIKFSGEGRMEVR